MIKKHISTVTMMAILAGIYQFGCSNVLEDPDTTMQMTNFEGTQGNCTNGGVKIEVLVDGVVDDTQTQYICNGTQGADGQTGQSGTNTIFQATQFEGTQGDCTNGGVKIEVLLDGVVDDTQTQYICKGVQGEDGTSTSIKMTKFDDAQGDCTNGGVKIEVLVNGVVDDTQTQYICNSNQSAVFCNGILIDSTRDSAHCGGCGNVCPARSECVNSTCTPTSVLSTTTLLCNAQMVTPYDDRLNCTGCGIKCGATEICKTGTCTTVNVGDTFFFGHYEQDNDTTNGKEPIEWRVLDLNTEGQILIISEKVLEQKRYNETYRSITWENSTIRSWLNGYAASYNSDGVDYTSNNFINTAFTESEQAKIVASNVPAHPNPNFSPPPGNATTDKIFLLSITEAKTYFANDASRKADATQYAVKQGLSVDGPESGKYTSDGTCTDIHCYARWWLRTPGYYTRSAADVYTGGDVHTTGTYVDHDSIGVRPALWLNY